MNRGSGRDRHADTAEGAGGRLHRPAGIFSDPGLPEIKDHDGPWTHEHANLPDAPLGDGCPGARPVPSVTGKPMRIQWSANGDGDLAGAPAHGELDPMVERTGERRPRRRCSRASRRPCSVCMRGDGPFGQDSGGRGNLPPGSGENFRLLRRRQTTDDAKEA
ncbi:hypothetical protein AB0F36_35730 [Streptomyces sp. NPDC029080]|uniref:hypothetical protein n=1 Tax=Streptomyces sp. NPDC029080 TaxID=3155017 RepID=UPI0033FC764A